MQLTLHTDFPTELKDEWNALLARSASHVPFLRHEYQQTWWQTRGGGEWQDATLALITAQRDGALVGVAPLFHARHNDRATLMLLGSIDISDYLDLLCAPDDLPQFTRALIDFLPVAGLPAWQKLSFFNVLESSPTLPALEAAAAAAGWGYSAERLSHSPYIPLPHDWETYLAGVDKKQRHEIRRKARRLEESGVPTRWYTVQEADTLEAEIDAFISLMAQDPDKEKFLSPAMRQMMAAGIRCAFEAGCLHLAFLEIDGHKAAAYYSFDYLNRLWVYNSGFNRDYLAYSPGWVLVSYILRWAIENGREAFDFMRGDEEYKYRMGAIDRFVLRADLTPR
ncbi:MAG: GNAT family N-acetyltransferase [Anaerolineae bacterium]|nr:GNAT family N-acetyltransferase [Anaerolineae bacterium]